jgi:hypothetical protein
MTVMTVTLSEPLGLEQCVDEVDHQPHGHEAGERIVEHHGKASSEPIAGDGVADRQREEAEPDGQHDEVKHLDVPCDSGCSGLRFSGTFLMCINSGRAFSPLGRRYVPLGAYVFEMEGKSTL